MVKVWIVPRFFFVSKIFWDGVGLPVREFSVPAGCFGLRSIAVSMLSALWCRQWSKSGDDTSYRCFCIPCRRHDRLGFLVAYEPQVVDEGSPIEDVQPQDVGLPVVQPPLLGRLYVVACGNVP